MLGHRFSRFKKKWLKKKQLWVFVNFFFFLMLVKTTALLFIYLVPLQYILYINCPAFMCGWIQHLFFLFQLQTPDLRCPELACSFMEPDSWLQCLGLAQFYPEGRLLTFLLQKTPSCRFPVCPVSSILLQVRLQSSSIRLQVQLQGQGDLLSDQLSNHLSDQSVVSCQTSRLTTSCSMVYGRIPLLICWLVSISVVFGPSLIIASIVWEKVLALRLTCTRLCIFT